MQRIGFGVLGYDTKQMGLMTMRQFTNASLGHRDKLNEVWQQARLIAYYSAVPHMKKGFRITDIPIPGDTETSKAESQMNKEEAYKLLDKWNK